MSTATGEYVYNWREEHGHDPFAGNLENEQDRRELESKINVILNLAIKRPAHPLAPNTPLLECAKEIRDRFGSSVMWKFYRVAGIPDPLDMERQRVARLKVLRKEKKFRQALNSLSSDDREKYYAEKERLRHSSHTGSWNYHDDDCLCWRYFDDARCNRGGYIWSCCGSTSEDSYCYNAPAVVDPIMKKIEEEEERAPQDEEINYLDVVDNSDPL